MYNHHNEKNQPWAITKTTPSVVANKAFIRQCSDLDTIHLNFFYAKVSQSLQCGGLYLNGEYTSPSLTCQVRKYVLTTLYYSLVNICHESDRVLGCK